MPWTVLLPRLGEDPSPDRSRDLLREELLGREYHQTNWVDRLQNWIRRLIDDGTSSAVSSGWGLVLLLVLLLAVGVGVILLVTRLRHTGAAATLPRGEAAVTAASRTASAHRQSAEAALAAGELDVAVLEAFRAQAVRLVEGGQLEDAPGATAAEWVARMAEVRPDLAEGLRAGARLFDAVHYGHLRPTAEDVVALLQVDDRLAGVRR